MKEKRSARATIDDMILGRLVAEKERTGLGPNKILRYMRNRGVMPPGSKLKVAQMESWLTGLAASAPQADLDAIFAAYAEIVPERELSSPAKDNQLILICEALSKELQEGLKVRRNSCRRALLKSPETPKGLTDYRLKRLCDGSDRTILASHLRHIRKATCATIMG